jgi:SET domain-containing protein
MTEEQLINELSRNTYVMLKPSPLEGVGVFAVREIPRGCRDMFSKPDPDDTWITVSKTEVELLPPHAKFMVENYCLFDKDSYFIPDHGFKKMDISLFINHSDTPNIRSIDDGDYFEAIRDIKPGEELLLDYGDIVEDGE